MDLIVLLFIIVIVILLFRKFNNFVYCIAIIDIFLRILDFIKFNLPIPEIKIFIAQYFPTSIPSIINKYSSGIFNTIIMWAYVIIFIFFEYYTIKTFFRKKK